MPASVRIALRMMNHLTDGTRRPTPLGVAVTLIGAGGIAWAITVLWLNMRAVMDVGGMCAQGGPYVIETPCPDGVAWMIPVSIVGGLAAAGVWVWGLWILDRGSPLPLAMPAWGALFGALGWNFMEYALDPPGSGGGPEWGWLVCGVVFWLMALPGVFALRGAVRYARSAGVRGRWGLGATAAGIALGIRLAVLMVAAAG